MNTTREAADEQKALWNGLAGRNWVEAQALIDTMFRPLQDLLVEAVAARSPHRILDVGCGPGSLTRAISRRLGDKCHCVGVDVAEPMIDAALAHVEREGAPADFLRADVQRHAFEPSSFDMIVSRFGVMFFDDFVEAFKNLRRSARDDAELRFLAWRSAAENPFMTAAEQAAAPLLPNLPPRQPNAPGQFAFGNADRVRGILEESGWTGIEIQPIDQTCVLPEKELDFYLTRLGPVGRVLHEVDEQTREKVMETVRAAFEPFAHGTEIRFTAACWMVGAKAVRV